MSSKYPVTPEMVAEIEVLLAQLTGPVSNVEAVDTSGGDVVPTMQNCRGIMCTAGTVIKVDAAMETGTKTVTLPAGRLMIPFPNIIKVYQTGTDATNMFLYR